MKLKIQIAIVKNMKPIANKDAKYEEKSQIEKDGKKKWNLKNVDPDISSHIKDVKWEEYIKF